MQNTHNTSVQVENFFFETDDAEGLGLRNGAPFEPEVLDALSRYIKPGAVVLDVGANVGYFTAFMAKYVGPMGLVHAFEPEPRNFELLQRNIATNHLKNVKTYNVALGDEAGTAKLNISEFSGGMHRLYESFCCGELMIEVSVHRLDDIFLNEKISVMKIDVEGFEPYVLNGARSLLQMGGTTIISEYCPPAILEAGASPVHFINYLMGFDMTVHEPHGIRAHWSLLLEDARKWEGFGRERLVSECDGKSNPEIANIVEKISEGLGCSRPYIQNLVFAPK